MSLEEYINELIQQNKLYRFYKGRGWIKLKNEVLHECNYECQRCLEHGRYTRADCVHHVNEVRQHPSMALDKYYIDQDGEKKRNLVPLCNRCHNDVHDKLGKWQQDNKKYNFNNKERW